MQVVTMWGFNHINYRHVIYHKLNHNHLPLRWPHIAAASATGNIFFTAIDIGFSLSDHCSWNHIGSRKAPHSHVPKALVYIIRLGLCKPRFHSRDILFHSSTKRYHHIISALAGRFSLIKWLGRLPISCIGYNLLKNGLPGCKTFVANSRRPVNFWRPFSLTLFYIVCCHSEKFSS